jgi:anti-anti-sigma factor
MARVVTGREEAHGGGIDIDPAPRSDGQLSVWPARLISQPVPALETSIMSAFADQDIDTVLVDLSAVTFLDSSGISVLLKGRRVADERAVNYRVVGADGIVRKVLDLTGVWPLLSGESA